MTGRTACVGLLVFAFALLKALTRSILSGDEAWFLQVLQRVTSGEVLYRDVFCGTTPLSVYFVAGLTTLWGTEVMLVRTVVVLSFMLTLFVSDAICRRLGASDRARIVLGLGFLALALPSPATPAGPLSTLLLMGCLWSTLRAVAEEDASGAVSRWRLLGMPAMAGAFAGLAFATKPHIGVYALGALALALLHGEPRGERRAQRVVAALLAFTFIAVALLLPVWLSGGWPRFWDYAFLNKTTYLRLAGVSYLDGLMSVGRFFLRPSLGGLRTLIFLVPPVALLAVASSWWRATGRERRETEVVWLFSIAATLGIFPRADALHVTYMAPVLLVALAHSWIRLRRPIPFLGSGHLAGVVGALAFLTAGAPLVETYGAAVDGTLGVSGLPHFRGVLTTPHSRAAVHPHLNGLGTARNESVFVLSQHAAFHYLATGRANPTPFDYPFATAFGRNGEDEVASAIAQGRIHALCLDPRILHSGRLRPERLVRFVMEAMEPVAKEDSCTLYRLRREAPSGNAPR